MSQSGDFWMRHWQKHVDWRYKIKQYVKKKHFKIKMYIRRGKKQYHSLFFEGLSRLEISLKRRKQPLAIEQGENYAKNMIVEKTSRVVIKKKLQLVTNIYSH